MILHLFDRIIEYYATIHRIIRDYLSNVLGLFVEFKTATSPAMTDFVSKFYILYIKGENTPRDNCFFCWVLNGALQFGIFYQWVAFETWTSNGCKIARCWFQSAALLY